MTRRCCNNIRQIFLLLISLFSLKFVNTQNETQTPQFGLIGDAIESFIPCGNGVLYMERIIGGPPSKENYWEGILDVARTNPNSTEARAIIKLDAPATVTVRIIGGPPSKENYWKGILNLKKVYPELKEEARVTIKLDAPATITVKPEEGRIVVSNGAYHLSFFDPANATFRVDGKPFGKFPNVEYLELNNVDVCPNPRKFKPSILGATNKGEIADSEEDSIGGNQQTEFGNCGRRLVVHQGLIKDGHPSKEGEWPWHAAIFHQDGASSYGYKCGGTLIDTSTILTAAHCVIENGRFIVPARVIVKVGLYHRLLGGRNVQEFQVYRIIPHEDFSFTYLHNDIAILKLATEATYTNYVQPVCLWPSTETGLSQVIDQIGEVVGWGFFNKENKLSDYLVQGTMPVVSALNCLQSNRDFYGQFVSDRNYCAGYRNGTSVCSGDSGGGMFFKKNNVYRMRGIVSLSMSFDDRQECNTFQYVIFTDIAQYLDWIEINKL